MIKQSGYFYPCVVYTPTGFNSVLTDCFVHFPGRKPPKNKQGPLFALTVQVVFHPIFQPLLTKRELLPVYSASRPDPNFRVFVFEAKQELVYVCVSVERGDETKNLRISWPLAIGQDL